MVDGPEFSSDHSYSLVEQCSLLKEVEQGIKASHFAKLNLEHNIPREDDAPYTECTVRDFEMEYRVLMRINCHMGQFQNIFRDPSAEFRRRNRYNDILPYKHNMVRVEDEADGRFNHYYNASYINVT